MSAQGPLNPAFRIRLVGISADVVADAGWVADSEGNWLGGVHGLARDPQLSARLRGVGGGRIEEELSPAHWMPTLAILRAA